MATDRQIKNKLQKLDRNNWIVRTNTLNEMRDSNMTITEMRLFAIYQSKINPKDASSRKVEFELSEFERIMELKRANVSVLEQVGRRIVTRTAVIRDNNGGFTAMPLFGEFKLYKDDNGKWVVRIDSHDVILPYLFEFKKYFFKYQLWNSLKLKSSNQQRMYEVLKQYEYAKATEITIDFLKALIGISQKQYTEWRDFKRDVLEVCQKALQEQTDIKFTYEPIKRGRGGKVVALKFNIEKNDDYVDQITLDEFIDLQPLTEQEDTPAEIDFDLNNLISDRREQAFSENINIFEDESVFEIKNKKLDFLADACDREFSEEQMQILYDLILKIVPFDSNKNIETERYDLLRMKYNDLKYRTSNKNLAPVVNRFAYLKTLLKSELENQEVRS